MSSPFSVCRLFILKFRVSKQRHGLGTIKASFNHTCQLLKTDFRTWHAILQVYKMKCSTQAKDSSFISSAILKYIGPLKASYCEVVALILSVCMWTQGNNNGMTTTADRSISEHLYVVLLVLVPLPLPSQGASIYKVTKQRQLGYDLGS